MKAIFILFNWAIETGEVRREFPTYAIEHSVFYLYTIDWIYLYRDLSGWRRILRGSRN